MPRNVELPLRIDYFNDQFDEIRKYFKNLGKTVKFTTASMKYDTYYFSFTHLFDYGNKGDHICSSESDDGGSRPIDYCGVDIDDSAEGGGQSAEDDGGSGGRGGGNNKVVGDKEGKKKQKKATSEKTDVALHPSVIQNNDSGNRETAEDNSGNSAEGGDQSAEDDGECGRIKESVGL